jgi:hypothetical protein
MSYALIGLCVMSIVVVLYAALRSLGTNRHVRHLFANYAQHTLAHPAGAGGSSSIVLRPDATGEGWALIDRALRARNAVRFDVR